MEEIIKTLNYSFKDKNLLKRALTHKSYSNEHKGEEHNERLEFLGDAILQYVSTDVLFSMFPDEPEGKLSVYRAAVVKTEYLAEIALSLNLDENIRISEGQRREFDRNRKSLSILADTIEALIGAIYIDGGIEEAKNFIQNFILSEIKQYLETINVRDAKTIYQEYAQQSKNITPKYLLHNESGPPHEKTFTVGLYLEDELISEGVGKSKQEGEKNAAQNALEQIPTEELSDAI